MCPSSFIKGNFSVSSPTEASLQDGQPYKIHMLQVYTACVSALGIVLLLTSIVQAPALLPGLLLFVGLVIIAELTSSASLQPQVLFSMSSAVTFAALLLFGPLAASLVAIIGGLVITFVTEFSSPRQKTPFYQRALFNMAALGVAIFVAGCVYILAGGTIGEVARRSNILPILLAAITAEFSNANLIIGAVAIQTRRSVYQIWKQNVSWAVPINILTMIVGGGGLAIGYQIAGLLGLGVFFLPIALTIYAFRLYVGQTRAQMNRLEEIIAERTEALQNANEELKRLDQVKTGFFSMINHEMRNPLSSIMGYTEILQIQGSLTETQERMLGEIEDSCDTLLGLVNDILDISRIEDGQLNVLPEPMQMRSAIDEALATLKPMIEKKCIKTTIHASSALPAANADPRRVGQILLNLLSNAIKYTPEAGQVTITIRSDKDNQIIETSIADTGNRHS